MSILELTTYLCADDLCVITTGDVPTEHDGPTALTAEDDGSTLEVETPLIPLTAIQRHEMYVETFMQPTEIEYPHLCRLDSTYLTWELLGHPFIGIYSDLGAYWIEITAKNPSICGFEGAQIRGEHVGVIKTYTPSTTGGEIPTRVSQDISQEDVSFIGTSTAILAYLPNGDVSWEWFGNDLGIPVFDGVDITVPVRGTSILRCSYTTLLQAEDVLNIDSTFDNTNDPQIQGDPMVIPGERISLWWKISKSDEYQEIAYDYIHTCCLTGGRVISLSRICDSIPTYTVFIEGAVHNNIISSDFREYEEGEWVYILKPSESGCPSCDRTSGCKGSAYSEGGIIIPIHITGVSP